MGSEMCIRDRPEGDQPGPPQGGSELDYCCRRCSAAHASRLDVLAPAPNSGVLVLPITIAPAARTPDAPTAVPAAARRAARLVPYAPLRQVGALLAVCGVGTPVRPHSGEHARGGARGGAPRGRAPRPGGGRQLRGGAPPRRHLHAAARRAADAPLLVTQDSPTKSIPPIIDISLFLQMSRK